MRNVANSTRYFCGSHSAVTPRRVATLAPMLHQAYGGKLSDLESARSDEATCCVTRLSVVL